MTENDELLADFAAYCKAHPHQRFWQALRNWSGQNFILAAADHHDACRDTFYWRSKDGINK